MFVDAKTILPALFALALTGCGGPSLVPSRMATDADVRQVQLAEALVTRGRAIALDANRPCEERRAGAADAIRGARAACRTAAGTDDRDLDTRCATARTGASEARAVTCDE